MTIPQLWQSSAGKRQTFVNAPGLAPIVANE
jgi:hypothetical protein